MVNNNNRRGRNARNGNRNTNPRRNGNNANVTPCATVSRADNTIISRKFHRFTSFALNSAHGDELQGTAAIVDQLDSYNQTEKLTSIYDQYRYKNITVYARLSGAGNPSLTSMATLNAAQCTTLSCAVDLDNVTPPTHVDVQNYDNLSLNSITNEWKRVASWAPRIFPGAGTVDNPSIVLPNSVSWLNTNDLRVRQLGLVCAGLMVGGSQWYTLAANTTPHITFQITATVEFRGRKLNTTV